MTAPARKRGSPERDYQRTLVATLEALGYAVNHTRPVFDAKAKRWVTPSTSPGWPDLLCVGSIRRTAGVVLAIEVKSDKGKPTAEQLAWLRRWHACPSAAAILARPSDPWNDTVRWLREPHQYAVSGWGWLPPEQHRTGLLAA